MTQITMPTVTDDIGDYQSGTILNAAFFTSLGSAIDDLVHESDYPTITPKTVIEEIGRFRDWSTVSATGVGGANNDELQEWLAVEHNVDGTHNLPATVVTTAVLAEQGFVNIVRNGTFEEWAISESTAPPGWVLSGTGATVVRTGEGESDTTRKIGRYAAKLSSVSAEAELRQTLIAAADWSKWDHEEGNKVVMGCWVWSADATSVHVMADDGNTTTDSTQHTGGSSWELLTVTHTISAAATKLDMVLVVEVTSNDGWFSGPFCIFSDSAPTRYPVSPYSPNVRFDAEHGGLVNQYSPRRIVIEDEFISGGGTAGSLAGQLGWLETKTGTSAYTLQAQAGHPGVFAVTTGATNADQSTYIAQGFMVADIKRFMFICKLGTTITNMKAFFGAGLAADRADVAVASGIEGLGYYYDTAVNNNWNAHIDNTASAAETDDSGVAAVASEYVKLEFVKLANGTWEFYLNDQLTHTSTLTIDAADTLEFKFGVHTISGGAKAIGVDYFAAEFVPSTNRIGA